jgi:hypothetical protein
MGFLTRFEALLIVSRCNAHQIIKISHEEGRLVHIG